jgi:hypothetical protein
MAARVARLDALGFVWELAELGPGPASVNKRVEAAFSFPTVNRFSVALLHGCTGFA